MRDLLWERFAKNAYRPFGEAAKRWLEASDAKDKYRQALCVESLEPYIARIPLIEVNGDTLTQFKDDRLKGTGYFSRPVKAGTVNKELRVLKAILHFARDELQWIPSAPKIKDVRGPTKVARPMRWEEVERLFRYLPETWAKGPARFALNTGVRWSELTGLKWSDMEPLPSLDGFCFYLRDTKNGKVRVVICNSEARKAVEYQRKEWAGCPSEYVFPSRRIQNKGSRLVSNRSAWMEAWEGAGMPMDDYTSKGWHNLRHTFASWLRACGVPPEDRDALMGHHGTDISQHYAQPDLERLTAAAELITDGDRLRQSVVLRVASVTA